MPSVKKVHQKRKGSKEVSSRSDSNVPLHKPAHAKIYNEDREVREGEALDKAYEFSQCTPLSSQDDLRAELNEKMSEGKNQKFPEAQMMKENDMIEEMPDLIFHSRDLKKPVPTALPSDLNSQHRAIASEPEGGKEVVHDNQTSKNATLPENNGILPKAPPPSKIPRSDVTYDSDEGEETMTRIHDRKSRHVNRVLIVLMLTALGIAIWAKTDPEYMQTIVWCATEIPIAYIGTLTGMAKGYTFFKPYGHVPKFAGAFTSGVIGTILVESVKDYTLEKLDIHPDLNVHLAYAALGLTKSATAEQIRRAYREKRRDSHPDRHEEKEDEYIELQRFYQLIRMDRDDLK